MAQNRKFSLEASRMLKRKSSELFRSLPKVPTTQYLEPSELTCDILYSGYRPVGYPVRETPLGHRKLPTPSLRGTPSELAAISSAPASMAGVSGNGGIGSGGVNGTWRYNPRIPSKLLPFNLWTSSSMAMECYPEWTAVPRNVVHRLRPFEPLKPLKPVAPVASASALKKSRSLQQQAAQQTRSVANAKTMADKKLSRQVDQFISYLREKDRR
ncbi:LAME_0F10022g1_1 [Lachancea meyersii CBS 8951]|uniref:LAME_0F10022g1_1 n=1 Tax=Lachancea meyersii CBS 8951 TaxID=1266667 RepID=A0A1G4JV95_9SACH|nr:LAME_0F10022g1_1 [Lachancea meyersii CBS 8951]